MLRDIDDCTRELRQRRSDLDERLEDAGATSLELKELLRVEGAYTAIRKGCREEIEYFEHQLAEGVGARVIGGEIRRKRSA